MNRQDTIRFLPLLLPALTVSVSVTAGTIAVALVYLAALVLLLVERGRAVWPEGAVTRSLLALVGAYFLATALAAPYPSHWAKFAEELWIKGLLVAVPLVAGRRPSVVRGALQVALVMGALAAAYAVAQNFLGVDPIRGRSIFRPDFGHTAVSGFFGHHLSYAGQILMLVLMTGALVLDRLERPWRERIPLLAGLGLMALALFWNYSRSAWVGAAAGLLALVWLHPGPARRWTLGAGGAALLVVMGIGPVRAHFLSIFRLEQHLTRLNLWRSSWDGLTAHPLLGFGPGNFSALLREHMVPGHYDSLAHSHNDLLMHGVNAGLPGIAAALTLLFFTCRLFWREWRRGGPDAWVFAGALVVQVGITVAGFFQVFQTDDEVEMLLYFLLGCALALATARKGETTRV